VAIDFTTTIPFHGDDFNNTLTGTAGQDEMYGYGGDDILVAGPGEDYLDGGNGNDLLAGGSLDLQDNPEPDLFLFDRDDGNDTITDFTPPSFSLFSSPGDQILLLGGNPQDVENILANATTTVTNQTVLVYGNTTIGLNGITANEVSSDWFMLV
jgi:Ca2+-binding RTX toxin-like protein